MGLYLGPRGSCPSEEPGSWSQKATVYASSRISDRFETHSHLGRVGLCAGWSVASAARIDGPHAEARVLPCVLVSRQALHRFSGLYRPALVIAFSVFSVRGQQTPDGEEVGHSCDGKKESRRGSPHGMSACVCASAQETVWGLDEQIFAP